MARRNEWIVSLIEALAQSDYRNRLVDQDFERPESSAGWKAQGQVEAGRNLPQLVDEFGEVSAGTVRALRVHTSVPKKPGARFTEPVPLLRNVSVVLSGRNPELHQPYCSKSIRLISGSLRSACTNCPQVSLSARAGKDSSIALASDRRMAGTSPSPT